MSNQRLLYYVPWSILDGIIYACGLGYSGIDPKTNKPKFDKFFNCYLIEIETSSSAA